MPSLSWVATALGIALALYYLAGHFVYQWAVANLTILNELKALGVDRNAKEKLKGTAVICGGSIAGLMAARVCAGHFEEVVIIDPDNDELVPRARASLGDGRSDPDLAHYPRPRVHQTRVLHATQTINLWALERLFPNFRTLVKAAGGVVGSQFMRLHTSGTHIPPPVEFYPKDGFPEAFNLSRGAYETVLRLLVSDIPNVRFVKGTVSGVKPSLANPKRLETVVYRPGPDAKLTLEQKAELVVDCSGASAGGATWLKRSGYSKPNKDVYHPHMRYRSFEFIVEPKEMAKFVPEGFEKTTGWLIINFPALDKEQRILMIEQLEHNRLWLALGGWGYSGDPNTIAKIREEVNTFRQDTPSPEWLWDLLDYLESGPEKTAHSFFPTLAASEYIQYHEKHLNLPENFVAVGDAIMKLNPVYAQGMTKATTGAVILDALLRRESSTVLSSIFAPTFFAEHDKKTKGLWQQNKTVDYMMPTTDIAPGGSRQMGAFTRWYISKFDALMKEGDREAAFIRFEVMQQIAPGTNFFKPSMVLKVALKELKKLVAGATS